MALVFTKRFKKAYRKLPRHIQPKVKKALQLLQTDLRYPSLQVQKIRTADDVYEGRVDRKYRFSFHLSGGDIILRNVDNHDECLKNP